MSSLNTLLLYILYVFCVFSVLHERFSQKIRLLIIQSSIEIWKFLNEKEELLSCIANLKILS